MGASRHTHSAAHYSEHAAVDLRKKAGGARHTIAAAAPAALPARGRVCSTPHSASRLELLACRGDGFFGHAELAADILDGGRAHAPAWADRRGRSRSTSHKLRWRGRPRPGGSGRCDRGTRRSGAATSCGMTRCRPRCPTRQRRRRRVARGPATQSEHKSQAVVARSTAVAVDSTK